MRVRKSREIARFPHALAKFPLAHQLFWPAHLVKTVDKIFELWPCLLAATPVADSEWRCPIPVPPFPTSQYGRVISRPDIMGRLRKRSFSCVRVVASRAMRGLRPAAAAGQRRPTCCPAAHAASVWTAASFSDLATCHPPGYQGRMRDRARGPKLRLLAAPDPSLCSRSSANNTGYSVGPSVGLPGYGNSEFESRSNSESTVPNMRNRDNDSCHPSMFPATAGVTESSPGVWPETASRYSCQNPARSGGE